MTNLSFILRNLRHYQTANLLVILGVAIGTAVLTGALLLGDSLKGSLKQLTLDRLGNIEEALVAERFFPAKLAERLGDKVVPVIILRGTVLRRSADGSQLLSRAGRVQIAGIDDRFWKLFNSPSRSLEDGVVINQALADALQVQATDGLEVRMEKPGSIPSESVLGQRSTDAALVLETTRLAGVIPNHGPGHFTLQPMQNEPLILYVKLESLQRRLADDQQQPAGSANVLLTYSSNDWQTRLNQQITLEDLGFTFELNAEKNVAVLSSRRLLVEPKVVELVTRNLTGTNVQAIQTLTYLANRIFRLDDGKPSKEFVPYSTVVGVSTVLGQEIADDAVVINDFISHDLGAGAKKIRIEYFVETDGHRLFEKEHDFNVVRVVPISGETADRSWTPEFPGMKGTLAEWNPPFPREQWHREWVRKRDEDYYKQYRATPKLFINPKTARKLFSSRFGDTTSIRMTKPAGQPFTGTEFADLQSRLTAMLRPGDLGLTWQNLKVQGIQSATSGGTTNMFGGLFAGFSLFLIVAAALLVALLFRLRLERRARELGLLLATGWPVKLMRRTALTEGLLLAIAGAVVGIPLALGYAWVMISSLRYGWGGLLASDSLRLYFTPTTLIIGAVISILIAGLAMLLSLKSLVKLPPPMLLAGRTELPTLGVTRLRPWRRWLPVILLVLALGLLGFGATLPLAQQPGCFFGAGFLFLVTAILWVSQYLHRTDHRTLKENSSLWNLGQLNISRSPNRSLSTIALLASGCFLVVAVGAFRKGKVDTTDKASGTGGYSLLAESDVPLRTVPHSLEDWKLLLGDRYDEVKDKVELLVNLPWVGLRLRNGDDVSCLNLYQPTRPRILGAGSTFTERGGFSVTLGILTMDETIRSNPWKYLQTSNDFNLFLDDHTAQWVMQKQLSDRITVQDELDQPREGFFAGMINGSIFQSELIVSENQFRQLYPSEAGYRFFLIDAVAEKQTIIRTALELVFGESHGMVVETTASKLAAFHAVENTYISTFQALGGLGLLLGTAGLALVILRNVQERQSEMALLQAIGFTRRQLAGTILSEVAWLTILGIAIGCAAALFVVIPLLTTGAAWQLAYWLVLVMLMVPIGALLSSLAGLRLALSSPLIPSLRGD